MDSEELTRTNSEGYAMHFAQVRTRPTPSKQAREGQAIGGAMTAHNFSPNMLAYDYESDYDASYDYYEHLQAMRVRMESEGRESEGVSGVQEQEVAS